MIGAPVRVEEWLVNCSRMHGYTVRELGEDMAASRNSVFGDVVVGLASSASSAPRR